MTVGIDTVPPGEASRQEPAGPRVRSADAGYLNSRQSLPGPGDKELRVLRACGKRATVGCFPAPLEILGRGFEDERPDASSETCAERRGRGGAQLAGRPGTEDGFRDLIAEAALRDRKSTRLNSSHQLISYAVFCLKKKKKK